MSDDDMSSWREDLIEAFAATGDNFGTMVSTLNDEELDVQFYHGYGAANGKPFTAWGEKYVYFPACYDGLEWVAWAPRNPCAEKTEHIGGG